jgi:hypothetical protein
MSGSSSAASKRIIVEALVLAFSHSEVREIVGTDALRSVVGVEYHDMTSGGSLDLQPLWELLEEQPGFDASRATPPMLLMKQWERQLGMPVLLPRALEGVNPGELARRAAEIKIPTPELRKLFRTDLVEAEEKKAEEKKTGKRRSGKNKSKKDKRSSPALVALAGTVAVAAFAFTGFSTYKQCHRRAEWQPVNVAEISAEVPVKGAERFGDQVGATLANNDWLGQPRDKREEQLRAALDKLRKKRVRVLFLKDQAGKVRATVQYSVKSGTYAFTFPGSKSP